MKPMSGAQELQAWLLERRDLFERESFSPLDLPPHFRQEGRHTLIGKYDMALYKWTLEGIIVRRDTVENPRAYERRWFVVNWEALRDYTPRAGHSKVSRYQRESYKGTAKRLERLEEAILHHFPDLFDYLVETADEED